MSYIAPGRAAILYLVASGCHWDALSVAMLAHISHHQAKIYCRHLVVAGVLFERLDFLQPGPGFSTWSSSSSRARPGGNAIEYWQERREREQLYRAQQDRREQLGLQVKQLRQGRGWGIRRLCRMAKVGVGVLRAIEMGKRNPREATVAKLQSALGSSLWVS